MQFPPEARIKFGIAQSSVYYYPDDALTSAEPHYFVVLNASPRSDRLLYLFCASSQVQKCIDRATRRNLPPSTLVHTGPQECSFLTRDTVIDCNSLFERPMSALIAKLAANRLRIHGTVPQPLLERLVAGALASPLSVEKPRNASRCLARILPRNAEDRRHRRVPLRRLSSRLLGGESLRMRMWTRSPVSRRSCKRFRGRPLAGGWIARRV